MKTFWLSLILAGTVCAEPAAVQQAIQEGLPAEPVRALIAEAQAKQVPAAERDAALQRRLTALREAKTMLQVNGYNCVGPGQQELLASVGRALESKVPTDALRQVLKSGGGTRAMRLAVVVDAGESLKLLGVDDATASALMQDFITRNLGRGEIVRAVQFVSQQCRAGVAGPRIREMLWSNKL